MPSIKKLTFIIVIMTTLFAFDGMSIGLNSMIDFQSATFHNDQLIYGLDFMHANVYSEFEIENSGQYNTNTEESSVSINIFMPRIGYKLPGPSSGKIDIYNQIEAYLVFPMVSIDTDNEFNSDNEEMLEDILDVMGFKISKIIQYNFNEQLSLMAHVGFNLTIGNIDNDLWEETFSGRLGMTYTKLSLKFNL